MPELTAQQAALMALLTDLGHIKPGLISLVRGRGRRRTIVGPIPMIRVASGFLGMPASYAFGWDSIRVFLDGVEGAFLLTMGELAPVGEGAGGVGGGMGGEVAGGGDVGEEREGVVEGDEGDSGDDSGHSSSSSSCCGSCWLGPNVCSCGGWRGDEDV